MERIEAIELLNTHFFNDTSECREAWYTIRAVLAESTNSSHNSAMDAIAILRDLISDIDAGNGEWSPSYGRARKLLQQHQ